MDIICGNTTASLFFKDRRLRYSWCSEHMAAILGLDSPHQIVGKVDSDLIWKKHAKFYRERDKAVIDRQQQLCLLQPQIRQQPDSTETLNVIVNITKNPMYDRSGSIVGIVGFFTEPIDSDLTKDLFYFDDQGRLSLGSFYGHSTLSKREHELLKCCLKGLKPQSIQAIMGIKKSSYDSIVHRIKHKMGCKTIGDVIYSSIKSGLAQVII